MIYQTLKLCYQSSNNSYMGVAQIPNHFFGPSKDDTTMGEISPRNGTKETTFQAMSE